MRSFFHQAGLLILLITGLSVGGYAQPSGKALAFSNMRQHKVSVPMTAPTGPFTLEAWVYFMGDSFSDGGSLNTVLEFGNDDVWFGVTFGGQVAVHNVISGGNVPTNGWAHLAYTWDGTSGRLYLNGTQVATNNTVPAPRGQNLGIGYNIGDTGWNGHIDEVMIWNVARTAAEIQNDRQQGASGSAVGLVAYFKFDEGSGQVVSNQVGGGPQGVLGSTANADLNDPAWVNNVITGVRKRGAEDAAQFQPNFPNPFVSATTVPFVLARAGHVRLSLLDAMGHEAILVLDQNYPAGKHSATIQANHLVPGVYICQLDVDGQRLTQRVMVQ